MKYQLADTMLFQKVCPVAASVGGIGQRTGQAEEMNWDSLQETEANCWVKVCLLMLYEQLIPIQSLVVASTTSQLICNNRECKGVHKLHWLLSGIKAT